MTFSPDGMHAIVCDNNRITTPPHGCVRLMTMTRDGGVERVDLFAGSALEGGHRVGNAHNARFGNMHMDQPPTARETTLSRISDNHCILRITPSADVTLYCGTPGSRWMGGWRERHGSVSDAPRGLCFDGQDNLLVADTNNHCIRLVSAMDQSVTTLVGRGPDNRGCDGGSLEEATLNCPSRSECGWRWKCVGG